MVDVVFSVKVNALGLFVDGHDRQSDVNGAMKLPLGDLEWRIGRGEMGLFLGPWGPQSHHLPEAQGPGSGFTLVPKHRQGLVSHPPVHITPHYVKSHSELQGVREQGKLLSEICKAEKANTLSEGELEHAGLRFLSPAQEGDEGTD